MVPQRRAAAINENLERGSKKQVRSRLDPELYLCVAAVTCPSSSLDLRVVHEPLLGAQIKWMVELLFCPINN